jgi:hypothetical protein
MTKTLAPGCFKTHRAQLIQSTGVEVSIEVESARSFDHEILSNLNRFDFRRNPFGRLLWKSKERYPGSGSSF